jgi:hypothetical protein
MGGSVLPPKEANLFKLIVVRVPLLQLSFLGFLFLSFSSCCGMDFGFGRQEGVFLLFLIFFGIEHCVGVLDGQILVVGPVGILNCSPGWMRMVFGS